ncbi:MAG: hypothetical protein OHK0046_35830 [Anaerolineae bacterium]
MPTPFTHLEVAQRLLTDDLIPQATRDLLKAERGAFLLGSIAADARVGSGAPRSTTHFYDYRDGISEHPWRVMVKENSDLLTPKDAAHRAFIAGYVAHLAIDENWSLRMVGPHFAAREWADNAFRFYMLHIILIYMDVRDLAALESWQAEALASAAPQAWLRFMTDDDLYVWQRLIYDQIKPGGISETLTIFGGRIGKAPEEIQAFLDDAVKMESGLWQHIPQTLLHEVETLGYAFAREQLMIYMAESA